MALNIGILAVTLFLAFGVALWLQPEWLIARLQRKSPEVVYSVQTAERVVALTIDDGPDATGSPDILEILDQYNAQATFFVITDHIPGNEAIVEKMIADGHELGNHLTSDQRSINLSEQEFESQLLAADAILAQYDDVLWMRPGSGFYNEAMLATIKEYGYQCVLGSVYPYDPQIGFSWFSAYYVLWKTEPGSIIVLHDYDRRGQRTAEALKIILPELAARGYRVVTLSELVTIGLDQ